MRQSKRRIHPRLAASLLALATVVFIALPAAADQPEDRGAVVLTTSIGGLTITQWLVNDSVYAFSQEVEGVFLFTLRNYPDGNLKSLEFRVVSGTIEQTTVQNFAPDGNFQREISQVRADGALVSETMTIFDGAGFPQVRRTRSLITEDGVQVWSVTIETFADGQPVLRQELQLPFHHDFVGRPLLNRPVAPRGLSRLSSGISGPQMARRSGAVPARYASKDAKGNTVLIEYLTVDGLLLKTKTKVYAPGQGLVRRTEETHTTAGVVRQTWVRTGEDAAPRTRGRHLEAVNFGRVRGAPGFEIALQVDGVVKGRMVRAEQIFVMGSDGFVSLGSSTVVAGADDEQSRNGQGAGASNSNGSEAPGRGKSDQSSDK